MHHKIQWRYFAALLIPSLVILLLAVWLTFYTHSRGMEAMRRDVEKSNLRVAQSIAENIDTLLEQIRLNASNPVSYTHLDVYKRQALLFECRKNTKLHNHGKHLSRSGFQHFSDHQKT